MGRRSSSLHLMLSGALEETPLRDAGEGEEGGCYREALKGVEGGDKEGLGEDDREKVGQHLCRSADVLDCWNGSIRGFTISLT